MRLADRLVGAVRRHRHQRRQRLRRFPGGVPRLLRRLGGRPAGDLASGEAKPDLLQLITTDSGPIITHCSTRLTESFIDMKVGTTAEDAGVLARAIVRLAMSYVSMPPSADHDVAADLARLMTPFAERYGVADIS
jgi:hypothetical protein